MKLSFLRHRLVRIYQSYFPKPLDQSENEFVSRILNDDLTALFYSQPLCDQRHGLLVYKKCLDLFKDEISPSNEELAVASFFHDVAKKDCRFSVSQRVIVATILGFIPKRKHENLINSKSKFLKRIGIYVDHSQISADIIKQLYESEFVYQATLFHHGDFAGQSPSPTQKNNVDLFIKADTL